MKNAGAGLRSGLQFSVPRAPLAQLPPVLHRPGHLPDWHLDDAAGHRVAGLPPHRLGVPAWRRQLRRPDPLIFHSAAGRRVGGPVGSPQGADCDTGARDGAVACPCGTDAERAHHHAVDHRFDALPGCHQRCRDPDPPVVRGADDRGPRQSEQRDRAQFVELQRGASGWPGHRGRAGGRGW